MQARIPTAAQVDEALRRTYARPELAPREPGAREPFKRTGSRDGLALGLGPAKGMGFVGHRFSPSGAGAGAAFGSRAESGPTSHAAIHGSDRIMAAAALMVEVAARDGDFSSGERAIIERLLRGHFSLDAKAGSFDLPSGSLDFGKTYYWRVEQENGSIPTAPGTVWAFRTEDATEPGDVTFFVGSDTHYGLGNNAELNRKVIDQMNWLNTIVAIAAIGKMNASAFTIDVIFVPVSSVWRKYSVCAP